MFVVSKAGAALEPVQATLRKVRQIRATMKRWQVNLQVTLLVTVSKWRQHGKTIPGVVFNLGFNSD